MALLSSSPGPALQSAASARTFHGVHLAIPPSSPTYQNGETSPSFDASFASSMSITADADAYSNNVPKASPRDMDISPAPQRQQQQQQQHHPSFASAHPIIAAPNFDRARPRLAALEATNSSSYPFFKNLFHSSRTTLSPEILSAEQEQDQEEADGFRLASPSTSASSSSGGRYIPFEFTASLSGIGNAGSGAGLGKPWVERERSASVSNAMLPPPLLAATRLDPSASSRPKVALSNTSRYSNVPTENLRPPPFHPIKRLSDPGVPTFAQLVASSPARMDLDSPRPSSQHPFGDSSPCSLHRPSGHPRSLSDSHAHPSPSRPAGSSTSSAAFVSSNSVTLFASSGSASGAPDDLADLFADDLSPIRPSSRKRFLAHDAENSPTPPPSEGSLGRAAFNCPAGRRSFEKSITMAAFGAGAGARRRSGTASGSHIASGSSTAFFNSNSTSATASSTASSSSSLAHCSSLANFRSTDSAPPPPSSSFISSSSAAAASSSTSTAASSKMDMGSSSYKRQAQVLNGKPMPKLMRRAYSVADAFVPLSTKDTNLPESRPSSSSSSSSSMMTMMNISDTGAKKTTTTMEQNKLRTAAALSRSPLTGFRTQEEKGKALPCFGVKEDGLMRISSSTLNDLFSGRFTDKVSRYLIVDCRFSYEFEGGHIAQAVNLSTTVDVEQALLAHDSVPGPSTSEDLVSGGKTVLIFHCEFSAKRAPTSAKHLRSKDRLMNVGCYPNVHYPEVYVLAGGYAEFWKSYPAHCEGPHGYISMDDPDHLAKRSIDLNAFRQQKRQFNRAKSFTFGEAASTAALLAIATGSTSSRGSSSSSILHARSNALAPNGFAFPPMLKTSSAISHTGTTVSKASKATMISSATSMIAEEDHHDSAGDSSFGTNHSGSSPGGGGAGESPCPPNNKIGRFSLKSGMESLVGGARGGRRGMERAQTSAVLMFGR